MPWVRLDDHFDEHPKLAKVSPVALALWVVGLAYCNRNLTDGFIPESIALRLIAARKPRGPIDELLTAGLWLKATSRLGFSIHDFEKYQPSKAEVLAERARIAAQRSVAGRARANGSVRVSGRFTSGATSDPPAGAPAGPPAGDQRNGKTPPAGDQRITSPDPVSDPDLGSYDRIESKLEGDSDLKAHPDLSGEVALQTRPRETIQGALASFRLAHARRYGREPTFSLSDRKAANCELSFIEFWRDLSQADRERVPGALDRYVNSNDPFYTSRSHALTWFIKSPDRWMSESPPEILSARDAITRDNVAAVKRLWEDVPDTPTSGRGTP